MNTHGFQTFNPSDQGDGHIYGIVHENVPIFDTYLYLGMANSIAKVIFLIIYIFFHFLSVKMVFSEARTKKYGAKWQHYNFLTK